MKREKRNFVIYLQVKEIKNNNNYFVGYMVRSFNSYMLPFLRSEFKVNNYPDIPYVGDKKPRYVRVKKYIEGPSRVYK